MIFDGILGSLSRGYDESAFGSCARNTVILTRPLSPYPWSHLVSGSPANTEDAFHSPPLCLCSFTSQADGLAPVTHIRSSCVLVMYFAGVPL
jgi:hypothetical protein